MTKPGHYRKVRVEWLTFFVGRTVILFFENIAVVGIAVVVVVVRIAVVVVGTVVAAVGDDDVIGY